MDSFPNTWRKCYELLKPGGHLIAFSGSRTYHRMAVAIEDAGLKSEINVFGFMVAGFLKAIILAMVGVLRKKMGNEPMVLAMYDPERFARWCRKRR